MGKVFSVFLKVHLLCRICRGWRKAVCLMNKKKKIFAKSHSTSLISWTLSVYPYGLIVKRLSRLQR